MGFNKIRKKIHVSVIALFILPAIPWAAYALPAFPGAMGWGSDTVGGRSPSAKLYKVNTTDDNSNAPSCSGNICTSSLRSALTASGPRIVIFTVGGTITLNSPIYVSNGYLTIAGQTAPGDGILIRDNGIQLGASYIIVRGLRIRVGDANLTMAMAATWGGSSPIHHNVIDHNSFSWSRDENIVLWQHPDYSYHDITLSWNIISESLKGGSGEGHGVLVGDGVSISNPASLTLHHNLFAHNDDRNPNIQGCVNTEVINNLVYNWGWYPGKTASKSVFIGTLSIKGPNTTSGDWSIDMNVPAYCTPFPDASVYVSHNIGPGRPTDTGDDWNIVYGGPTGPNQKFRTNSPPFTLSNVTVDDVSTLKPKILAGVGATAPTRDSVDTRVINDVNNLTGSHISSQSQVGGWPTMASGTYSTDTDGDGMPNAWETARGLNPNDPSDWNKDRDGDGYLNIEEYINSFFPTVVSSLPPPFALIPTPPSIIGID